MRVPSSTPPRDVDLLERYLAQEVTPEELTELETAIRAPGGDVDQLHTISDLLSGPQATEHESRQRLHAVRERLGLAHQNSLNHPIGTTRQASVPSTPPVFPMPPALQTRLRSSNGNRWLGYVAGAALLVLSAPTLTRQIKQALIAAPTAPTFKEFRTGAGQRARITLPDHSTILLAPQSVIRYATDFSPESNRTVTLQGQALFTVTHAAGAPFLVQTGNVATRVLGTSFAVRRYATDQTVKVVVAEGRVSVGQTTLSTGDVAVAATMNQVTVSRGNTVTEQLAWTQGKLVFFGVTLRDVIPELERWYGVTIQVMDPELLDRPVNTTLDASAGPEAIELVAYSVEGRARISGRQVVIQTR